MIRAHHAAALLLAAAAGACSASASGGTVPAAAAAGTARPAPAPASPEPAGAIYSDAQAGRGRDAFRRVCAECHYASEFRDAQFRYKWGGRTVRDLYREIVRNMPEDAPGSRPSQEYVDIVSYILQLNGFPPGSAELPVDEAVMQGYGLTPPGGTRAPGEAP